MKAQVKAVKIGMVKIVALVLMMLGMNVQAEIIDYLGYKSHQDLIENKGILVVPIKIIGVESFVATLAFDYSKTTKYTKPTISLRIPVDENNARIISFESYSLTIYQLNQMADKLEIKLDYCTKALLYNAFSAGEGLFITSEYSLCKSKEVINLDQVIRTVSYREIRN